MKKVSAILILCLVFSYGCTGKVDISKFVEIYPGMSCSELDEYIETNKIPFKKENDIYKFAIEGDIWQKASIKCDEILTTIELESKRYSEPKHALAYTNIRYLLLNEFRNSKITFDEGYGIVNFGNGIELQQVIDVKTGTVVQFRITVDNGKNSRDIWSKTAKALFDKEKTGA